MSNATTSTKHSRKTKLLFIALGYVTFGFLSVL